MMAPKTGRRTAPSSLSACVLLAGVFLGALCSPATASDPATSPARQLRPIQILPDGPPVMIGSRESGTSPSVGIPMPRDVFKAVQPPSLPVPSAAPSDYEAERRAAAKARFWLVLWERTRGPAFLLILTIVFIGLLLLSLRRRGPTRLGTVSAQSVVLSIVVHLMLLVGFDSWVLTQRVIQTLRDPEFEILVDSENLLEERLSLGIREETMDLPTADSAMAVAPQEAELPLPEVIPSEKAPPVVPGQIELEVYEFPTELAQPEPRKRKEPAPALAARVAPDFKIAPPLPAFELPQPARAPEPDPTDSVKPDMTLEKIEEPLDARVSPVPSIVDVPPTELDAALLAGLLDTPALPPARPDLPERKPVAEALSDRMIVSAPNMKFQVPKFRPPEEPPEAPVPRPELPPLEPETEPPDQARPARPTSLEPGAPLEASIVALPAPAGVLRQSKHEPGIPRRSLIPNTSPKPVPPPFTLEERPFMSEPYKLRKPEARALVLEKMGGTTETEEAVQDALKWLAFHQNEDGRWDLDGFDQDCGKCGGAGRSAGSDVAATALSTLAFLGAGHSHQSEGPYQATVAKAIRWLIAQEKSGGNLSGRGTMYDQGMAAIALAEAYGMTHDPDLRAVVERAVAYIVKAQHPETGGWRYFPGDPGDTSVFGWQVMALKSARMGGLSVPQRTLDLAERWLKSVGGGEHGGLYGYQKPTPTQAMVAEGMFCRQLLGTPPNDPKMTESAGYLSERLPSNRDTNFYYWYYGTLACFQHQGKVWEDWNEAMRGALLPTQGKSGRREGSWTPVGQWGGEAGRVVQTALATLSLEVYYRYLPLYSPLSADALAKSDKNRGRKSE